METTLKLRRVSLLNQEILKDVWFHSYHMRINISVFHRHSDALKKSQIRFYSSSRQRRKYWKQLLPDERQKRNSVFFSFQGPYSENWKAKNLHGNARLLRETQLPLSSVRQQLKFYDPDRPTTRLFSAILFLSVFVLSEKTFHYFHTAFVLSWPLDIRSAQLLASSQNFGVIGRFTVVRQWNSMF